MNGLITVISIEPETGLKELVARSVTSLYNAHAIGSMFLNLNSDMNDIILSELNEEIQIINNLTIEEADALAEGEYTEEMAEYEHACESETSALKLIKEASDWSPQNEYAQDFKDLILNDLKQCLNRNASECKSEPKKITGEEYKAREIDSLNSKLVAVRLQKMALTTNDAEKNEFLKEILNSINENTPTDQKD